VDSERVDLPGDLHITTFHAVVVDLDVGSMWGVRGTSRSGRGSAIVALCMLAVPRNEPGTHTHLGAAVYARYYY